MILLVRDQCHLRRVQVRSQSNKGVAEQRAIIALRAAPCPDQDDAAHGVVAFVLERNRRWTGADLDAGNFFRRRGRRQIAELGEHLTVHEYLKGQRPGARSE